MKFLVLIILTIAYGIHGFGSGKLPKSVCQGIENTVWKFQKFPAAQILILREINFEESRSAKNAVFAIFDKFHPSKSAIIHKKSKCEKMADFETLCRFANFNFT